MFYLASMCHPLQQSFHQSDNEWPTKLLTHQFLHTSILIKHPWEFLSFLHLYSTGLLPISDQLGWLYISECCFWVNMILYHPNYESHPIPQIKCPQWLGSQHVINISKTLHLRVSFGCVGGVFHRRGDSFSSDFRLSKPKQRGKLTPWTPP
jgi:hypothetical protein